MNALTNLAIEPPETDTSLTIADAQQILAAWTDLPPNRLQKLRTALSTAARVLAPTQPKAAAAAHVQMDCHSLSRILQAPAATLGLSAGRKTSLCSELRAILRRLDRHEPDRRGVDLQSTALRACQAALPTHRRLALIDFLRFLDTEQIPPEVADGSTLSAYLNRCSQRTLCADPAARGRQIAAAWNWACRNLPDWPGKPLTRSGRTDRYSFPVETYLPSFQQDVARYADRLGGADLTYLLAEKFFADDDGEIGHFQRRLRPASIKNRLWLVRCAAGALVIMGFDQQQITSLRDLVHPLDRAETIIRFFLKRLGNGKSSPMAGRIAQTLLLLARDYCGCGAAEVATLSTWAKRVKPPAPTGLTEKNIRRLRALMQPRARAMLLNFPQELMRRATAPSLKPPEAARLAMYAVAMEILLICPMRRKNLCELRLDRHLYRPDPRRKRLTHLLIDAGEVKNSNAIQWPIPSESARLIEVFLARHRPHLVEPGNPYLFGTDDKQRSAQHLGEWLAAAVTEAIGVEFNVHLARHFAAWNFLRENPGQYEVIRQVLGHTNINVTIDYYVGLEADSAARHFDATVLRDRRAGRSLAAHAFRQTTPRKRSA